MALSENTARTMREDPDRFLRGLREASEAHRVPYTPPTAAEAATMAIRGPWPVMDTLAVLGPWAGVVVALIMLSLGSLTVTLVIVTQAVAAVVTTGAVLWRRYKRRQNPDT